MTDKSFILPNAIGTPLGLVRGERNEYERHLAGQPRLADFMPAAGPAPDDAVKNFMACLQDWLLEETRLRAIYRPRA